MLNEGSEVCTGKKVVCIQRLWPHVRAVPLMKAPSPKTAGVSEKSVS